MQSWVTNSRGGPVGQGQPASAYDQEPQSQQPVEASRQSLRAPENRYHQSVPLSANNNVDRAAIAQAARIPSSTPAQSASDGPRATQRAKLNASELQRPKAFWEGSTIDGSAFSDTASNVDSVTARPFHFTVDQTRASHRHSRNEPARRDMQKPPAFLMRPDGLMGDLPDHHIGRTTTPVRSSRGNGSQDVPSELGSSLDEEEMSFRGRVDQPTPKKHQNSRNEPLRTVKVQGYHQRSTYSGVDSAVLPPRGALYDTPKASRVQGRSSRMVQAPHEDRDMRRSVTPAERAPSLEDGFDSDHESMEMEPTPRPTVRTKQPLRKTVHRTQPHESDGPSESGDSILPDPTTEVTRQLSLPTPSTTVRKRQFDLDYDDGALAAMKFTDLQDEAFDFDPAKAEAQSAGAPSGGNLPQKLEHFFHKDPDAQAEFFSSMSLRDWETSGDWLLDKFGDIMQRFKNARQTTRLITEQFEKEVAEREEVVRSKTQSIGQTLEDLKSEGEGMMKKKAIR